MHWSSEHAKWLIDTGKRLKTADKKTVEVWELRYKKDEAILNKWAKHFRNHYCLDTEIDYYRRGYGYSRAEYLNKIKFPDPSEAPGPSIRAGDFGEILVADFLEYLLGYWVPRTKYADKDVRNESSKGCDILGLKIIDKSDESQEDTLAIVETKAQFSGRKPKPRLQDAIDGSAKDYLRKAESLNSVKQRLFDKGLLEDALKIERFQNPEDHPYKEIYGAVALFTREVFNDHTVSKADANNHPDKGNLFLIVICGRDFMSLVNDLYKRASDEA